MLSNERPAAKTQFRLCLSLFIEYDEHMSTIINIFLRLLVVRKKKTYEPYF
jgi:hypothetical protein